MNQTRAQELLKFYDEAGVKDKITQGANTPWPNRAEAAVKLFKKHSEILIDSLRRQGHLDKDWKRFTCLLYTSPSPRDRPRSRMPSSA